MPVEGTAKSAMIIYGSAIGLKTGTAIVGDYLSDKIKNKFIEKRKIEGEGK